MELLKKKLGFAAVMNPDNGNLDLLKDLTPESLLNYKDVDTRIAGASFEGAAINEIQTFLKAAKLYPCDKNLYLSNDPGYRKARNAFLAYLMSGYISVYTLSEFSREVLGHDDDTALHYAAMNLHNLSYKNKNNDSINSEYFDCEPDARHFCILYNQIQEVQKNGALFSSPKYAVYIGVHEESYEYADYIMVIDYGKMLSEKILTATPMKKRIENGLKPALEPEQISGLGYKHSYIEAGWEDKSFHTFSDLVKYRGLSYGDVARKTGISKMTISRYNDEQNLLSASVNKLNTVANALGYLNCSDLLSDLQLLNSLCAHE